MRGQKLLIDRIREEALIKKPGKIVMPPNVVTAKILKCNKVHLSAVIRELRKKKEVVQLSNSAYKLFELKKSMTKETIIVPSIKELVSKHGMSRGTAIGAIWNLKKNTGKEVISEK